MTTNNNNLHPRHGFTLIEVLVGLTITLIVLVAMMQAFKFASEQMSKGRASVELTNRLRTAQALLRKDLDRLTLKPKCYYLESAEPKGYFEAVDGPATDTNSIATSLASPPTDANALANLASTSIRNLTIGDYDDLWCGTIRSDAQPFRGRHGITIEESHLAEVIWFTVPNDRDSDGVIGVDERVNLFRRVLLIKPGLGNAIIGGVPQVFGTFLEAVVAKDTYLQSNDVSVAVRPTVGGWEVFANSLQSLTLRNNRFFTATHGLVAGANDAQRALNYRSRLWNNPSRRSSDNQNLILNDVAAFDIQVYDPSANVYVNASGGVVRALVSPSDCGLKTFNGTTNFVGGESGNNTLAPLGTFVDLGKTAGTGNFAGSGNNLLRFRDQVYDTGTSLYDRNNFDDDGDGLIDEGGNKRDDGLFDGVIDDIREKEVQPTFVAPIEGLSIKIRLIEPTSGQVSQVTTKKSF